MHKLTRRRFVLGSATAAAALALPIRRVLGANETINIGVVGCGWRGGELTANFSKVAGVRVAGLCDPDSAVLDECQKKAPDAKRFTDMRKMFEDKSIDAIAIATCNHWHALAAIWACQAGKDVYVEKPLAQTIWEGRKVVEAARKYNRIAQGGTHQRSNPLYDDIRGFIKAGSIGKMQWIRGNRFGVRPSIGKQAESLKTPETLNYDLWLGPAADLPIHRTKFHYDWHWIWNTGAGEMGNWGVHILDDIRNMLDDRCAIPRRVLSAGQRVGFNDAGETPNVHVAYFDTGDIPVIFSLSNLPVKPGDKKGCEYRKNTSGFVIQCENGYYAGGRSGGAVYDNKGTLIKQFKNDPGLGLGHAQNFIDAVRSRDSKKLAADVEKTHYSSAWCHLANIAFRLGSQYKKEQAMEIAKSFGPWQELVGGLHEHLATHQIDPASLKVSSVLEFDAKTETFTGPSATPQALALLTREYRKPYVVPDKV